MHCVSSLPYFIAMVCPQGGQILQKEVKSFGNSSCTQGVSSNSLMYQTLCAQTFQQSVTPVKASNYRQACKGAIGPLFLVLPLLQIYIFFQVQVHNFALTSVPGTFKICVSTSWKYKSILTFMTTVKYGQTWEWAHTPASVEGYCILMLWNRKWMSWYCILAWCVFHFKDRHCKWKLFTEHWQLY